MNSVVLKPFFRVTRRIDELATAFDPLFQKYCEPLADLNLVPDESMKRRLFVRLQPHLSASLNETFRVPSECSFEANKEGTCSKKGNIRKLSGRETSNELDFHMSVSAKYLLISAFLASRNPATLDAALFDSTGGSNNRKRKKKYGLFVFSIYFFKAYVIVRWLLGSLDPWITDVNEQPCKRIAIDISLV